MSVSVKQYGAVLVRPTLAQRLAAAGSWLLLAWQTFRTRQALSELDQRALADLGISPAQARFEADRAFWDLYGITRR